MFRKLYTQIDKEYAPVALEILLLALFHGGVGKVRLV
jgi:hypothetical protein